MEPPPSKVAIELVLPQFKRLVRELVQVDAAGRHPLGLPKPRPASTATSAFGVLRPSGGA